LVLSPLLALFSPFGAILLVAGAAAVRFWSVIAAGAQRAAALIPGALALIQAAIRNLFAGNFATAWTQFAEGARTAFATLSAAALRAQGPIGAIARGIQQVATDFPAAVVKIGAALVALGVAATGVANIINRIFGTELTGTDIALIAIVGQLTGAFNLLAVAATIVGAIFTTLVASITIIGVAFGTTAAAFVAGAALIVAALAGIVIFWDEIVAGAQQLDIRCC